MLRRIGALLSVRVLGAGAQALVLVYLARHLGPVEFAGLAGTLAFGGVVSTVSGFGGRVQALRLLAVPDHAQYATTLSFVRIATAAASACVSVLAGTILFGLGLDIALLVGAYAGAEAVITFFQHLFLGVQDPGRANLSIVLKPLLTAAGIAVSLSAGYGPMLGFAAGGLVAAAVSTLLALKHMSGFVSLRRVVTDSRSYWASTTLASLQQLDVAVVTAIAPGVSAGNYAGASRIVTPMNLAISSVLSIVTPDLSKIRNPEERAVLFGRATRSVGFVSVMFALAAPALGIVGPLILGSEYEGSAILFVAMGIALAINAFTQVYASSFYAMGMAGRLARIRLWTAPLGLAIYSGAALIGSGFALALGVVLARLIELTTLGLAHRRAM